MGKYLNTVKSTLRHWLDIPDTQARQKLKKLPPVPPPSAYTQISQNLARLTVNQQQQLMLWLYMTNFMCRDIVRLVVDPVVGKGFGVSFHDETPTIQEIVTRYQTFNLLDQRNVQKALTRSYINTGEVLLLTAPYQDTWYTVHCPSLLIYQTLLDPLNPMQIIGILLQPDYFNGQMFFYKTITNESRLSAEAKAIRAQWAHSCFYFYNNEIDEFWDAPGWEIPAKIAASLPEGSENWNRRQRRGTPFFYCWSDLYNHLVEVLWAFMDKSKSWGNFNWHFQVQTDEEDFDKSVMKVQQWQDAIGTPAMNAAIYTDERLNVSPLSFPMHSADIQKILDIMLQMSGLSANIPMYDLGSTQHTPFATAKAQGSPKEQFTQSIQTDKEEMYLYQYKHVLQDAEQSGRIPRKELEALKN
jgi:hypothetical protein